LKDEEMGDGRWEQAEDLVEIYEVAVYGEGDGCQRSGTYLCVSRSSLCTASGSRIGHGW
jgi:hypothetical protein